MIADLLVVLLNAQHSAKWQISTADTSAVIEVVDNRQSVAKLQCVQDGRTWCENSSVPLIDHVWSADRLSKTQWAFKSGRLSHGGTTLTLSFENLEPKLEFRSIWRARPGAGPIEHWVEISNRSATKVAIPEQESLELSGVKPGGNSEVWWVRRGASNALTEGGVYQEPVKQGMSLNLESNHQDPRSPVPWLAVQVGKSHGMYMGWEFSSLGRLHASSSATESVDLRAGLMTNFKTDILPRTTFSIPAAFVGCYRGDLDQGAARLHKFVLEKLRKTPPKSFADPCLVCNEYLDAGGDKASEQDLLRCVAFAKSLDLDAFMSDAMWFPACGDWRWDPKRFPNGGRPISDAIHADGMKVGLWCAWTNGGISSDPGALSVRGPVGHPDWFSHDLAPDWQPGPFYGAKADMGCDEARAWAIKKTQSLASDLQLDLLKTDCDPMINDCIRTDHRHAYGADVSYWSTMGVYEVWDKLLKANPKLVLENCSGASHIKDFGALQRCAYTTTTDTLSNLPDRAGIYDSTFVLPPASLMTYTYERGYGLPGDDPGTYLFRSAMMTAWQVDPTNSKIWTDDERAAAIECVRTYKQWLRPILKDCEVHHVLPRPDGKRWDGMFLWSPNLKKGTLFVFRPDSEVGHQTVHLAGLMPDKQYLVWSEDGSISTGERSGEELMSRGLDIPLPARYTSDLVHLQAAELPNPKAWNKPHQHKISAAGR